MKKYILLLVLTSALLTILFLSVTTPVMATDPSPEATPVAWVSFSGNTTGGTHLIELLSDGTTIGQMDKTYTIERTVFKLSFLDQSATQFFGYNGSSVVEWEGMFVRQDDDSACRVKITMVDNGDSREKPDGFMLWVWMPDFGYSLDRWWPYLGPQDRADPEFGMPVPVRGSDIYIHLPE